MGQMVTVFVAFKPVCSSLPGYLRGKLCGCYGNNKVCPALGSGRKVWPSFVGRLMGEAMSTR